MFDNPFLSEDYKQAEIEKYGRTRLGRQELFGELLEDIEGALWSNKLIEQARDLDERACQKLINSGQLELTRLIVAVDPAVTANKLSDETGIIIAALGDDGHVYVLDDLSGPYSPHEWAQKAVSAYHAHQANLIVAEKNQGGDLVAANLRAADARIPIRLVHASRGKITRAEPVAALYERKLVHHLKDLPELETQMTHYTGDTRSASPDRLDALVYAITELALNPATAQRAGYSNVIAFG